MHGLRLEGDSVILLVIKTHLSWCFLLAIDPFSLRRSGSSSQIINQAQEVGEQAFRDRDLGELEREIATVANDLGADLDQLLSKRRQRPMLHRLGQGERT